MEFDYMTVWMVAKEIMLQHPGTVTVQFLHHDNRSYSTVSMEVGEDAEHFQVWAGDWRPPRVPRPRRAGRLDGVEDDRQPRRRKKKHRTGVRVVSPATVARVPAVAAPAPAPAPAPAAPEAVVHYFSFSESGSDDSEPDGGESESDRRDGESDSESSEPDRPPPREPQPVGVRAPDADGAPAPAPPSPHVPPAPAPAPAAAPPSPSPTPAPPSPSPAPAPPSPSAEVAAHERHVVRGLGPGAEPWKEFSISKIYRDGIFIGWGGNCGKHPGKTICKKALTLGVGANALTEHEAKLRVKQWLLMGRAIQEEARQEDSLAAGQAIPSTARSRHIAIDASRFALWPEARIESS